MEIKIIPKNGLTSMQIFALEKNALIPAASAEKRKNYTCPQCQQLLRLKSGPKITPHFYHLSKSLCEREQKGLIHLKLQLYLQKLLGPSATLEEPYPSIGRIADVASGLCIYEIQYSPMTLTEAKARCRDYESLGKTLIWILHEDTFRKKSPSPAEQFLRTQTCYYTNMDKDGDGIIYDWLPAFGKRPVNLKAQKPLPKKDWPRALQMRSQTWNHYHEGDFFSLALQGKLPEDRPKRRIGHRLKEGYLALFTHLLKTQSHY
jgi:hypothetical protein